MDKKTYDTKMRLVIFLFVSLFLAILISTSIADRILPVDVHSSTAQIDNIKNQNLSNRLFSFFWMLIIAIGLIFGYFRKNKIEQF